VAPYVAFDGPLQLSLNLRLPIVLVPPGSTAPCLLIAHLGDLNVENFLKEDANGQVVENILVAVDNIFLTKGRFFSNSVVFQSWLLGE